jgi:hypothetical protein
LPSNTGHRSPPSRGWQSSKPPSASIAKPAALSSLPPLVTSTPRSAYLAVVFLTLMESYLCAALLPAMVEATSAWCGVHDAGAKFWSEHQVGHRICEWIEKTLADDPQAPAASVHDDLGKCLDVLVRSGIASARILEARIADDSSRNKSA